MPKHVEYQISQNNRRETQQYHTLELGVDLAREQGVMERVCALEVGPFASMLEAKSFALEARGASASRLLTQHPQLVAPYDMSAEEIRAVPYPIVGATFCTSTDADGTVDSFDLY